ncbi:MAG: hypothetical protein SF028_12815 [Candidatus Sumerlaeia bacterium]|nr:hypothetical protein [Candidatus Sumerlaeia bacterium]
MRCPACDTTNREDRATCYHCGRDLRLLRLIVNSARNHYNKATEYIERDQLRNAMGELDEALLLNAKFAEAYVLRGALLLRLGREDEARRSWDEALALEPTLARAHTYLTNAGALARAVPAARRAPMLLAGAAALVLLVSAGAFWAARPSRAELTLQAAWSDFASRNLAAADRALDGLPRPLPRKRLEQSAAFLDASIAAVERRFLDAATASISAGAFEAAEETLRELESAQPTERGRESVARSRAAVRSVLEARVRELLAKPLDSAATREVERAVERFAAVTSDAAGAEALRAELAQRLRERLEAQVDSLLAGEADPERIREAERLLAHGGASGLAAADRARLEETLRMAAQDGLRSALARAAQALARGDGRAAVEAELARAESLSETAGRRADVEALRIELAAREAEELLARMRAAADSGDGALFRALSRELDRMPVIPPGVAAEASALEAEQDRAERASFDTRLSEALAARSFDRALALAEEARGAGLELTESQRAAVADARRGRALDAYYALAELATDLERGALPPDPERVLALADLELEELPTRLRPRAEELTLFARAAAHRAMGDPAAAAASEAELRARFPASAYLPAAE